MLRERIIWAVALLAVAGIGFFGGQRVGITMGQQDQAQARQQFFANRGGQAGQAPGAQGGAIGRGLNGTVSAISGTTVTMTGRDGSVTTIQLAADGTVRKQVDGQLADIKPGDRITVIGAQNGDVFQATSIQIGGFGGPGVPGNTPRTQP